MFILKYKQYISPKVVKVLVVILILVLMVCSFWFVHHQRQVAIQRAIARAEALKKIKAKPKVVVQEKIYDVVLGEVTYRDIPRVVQSRGVLESDRIKTLSSDLDGKVVSIYFQDGDHVSQHDAIVQLGDRDRLVRFTESQIAYNLSKDALERHQVLGEDKAVSSDHINELRSDMLHKKDSMDRDLLDLEKTTLRSPYDGVLEVFQVKVGDSVKSGEKIVDVLDKEYLRVHYLLPATFLPKMRIGQVVIVSWDAFPGEFFYGEVTGINPHETSYPGKMSIQAKITNNNLFLTPGMPVALSQELYDFGKIWMVPATACVFMGGKSYVYRIKDGRAYRQAVIIGREGEGWVEIVQGLREGETIVVRSRDPIFDGVKIRAVDDRD